MNDQETLELLERELATFRDESCAETTRRIDGDPLTCERLGPSGTHYHIEIQSSGAIGSEARPRNGLHR